MGHLHSIITFYFSSGTIFVYDKCFVKPTRRLLILCVNLASLRYLVKHYLRCCCQEIL